MVKQAEKRRGRSPFLPILGLFLAIVLLAIAWGTASYIYNIPSVRAALANLPMTQIPNAITGRPNTQGLILLVFVLWLIFLAVAYFLVAVLTGKDPESTKDIPLPPRGKEKKSR